MKIHTHIYYISSIVKPRVALDMKHVIKKSNDKNYQSLYTLSTYVYKIHNLT